MKLVNLICGEEKMHVKTLSRKTVSVIASSLIFFLSFAFAQAQRGYAQTLAPPNTQTMMASDVGVTKNASPNQPAVVLDQEMLLKELAAMEARIVQLEAELKGRATQPPPAATAVAPAMASPTAPMPTATPTAPVATATPAAQAPAEPAPAMAQATTETPAASPEKPAKIAPFSDWDWTWLNGNPRNKDVAFDSKFFTPEIRADVTYTYDFNKPIDNSMGGSSELFRSNEIQLEQLAVGGDFHYDNVRARLLTDYGMYSTATPRNDPSPAKGQWNLSASLLRPGGSLRRIPPQCYARDQP